MSKKVGVELVISAVDEVTYKVMAINEKLKKFTDPINKLNTAFGDLARESGLSKVGERIGNVGSKFSSFVGEAAKGLGIMAGLGYGFFRLVKGAADFGGALQDTSDRLGISTDSLQAWQYGAMQVGVSAEGVEKSLNKFSKAVGDASNNEGDGVGIFRGMGIALRDAKGNIRSMEDLLPEFADQFAKIENPITRNAIAIRVFGKEGGKFSEILKKGRAGIAEFTAEATKNGAILGKDQIAGLDNFGDRFDALMRQFEVFKAQAIARIMPQLMTLLESASTWMSQNQEKVAAFADEFAKNLPTYIEVVMSLLKGVAAIVGFCASAFSALSSVIGESNAAFVVLGATVFRGTIMAFGSLIGSIFSLVGAAIPLLISGLTVVISSLWTLTAAIFAIPGIGWILAIIAAVIALSVAIYQNWGPIKDFMKDLWGGIVDYAMAAADKVMEIVQKVKDTFGFGGEKIQVAASGLPAGATGPSSGGQAAAAAVKGQISSQSNESVVRVDFSNMPKGARAEVQKSDVPLDLNLGYGMM